jgi:hypothetical protein
MRGGGERRVGEFKVEESKKQKQKKKINAEDTESAEGAEKRCGVLMQLSCRR